MRSTRISNPQHRDRLFLLNALAIVLLSLRGAAGEGLGDDKHSRANTIKRRTHALFPRACRVLYHLIPNMPEERLYVPSWHVSARCALSPVLLRECSGLPEMRGFRRKRRKRHFVKIPVSARTFFAESRRNRHLCLSHSPAIGDYYKLILLDSMVTH